MPSYETWSSVKLDQMLQLISSFIEGTWWLFLGYTPGLSIHLERKLEFNNWDNNEMLVWREDQEVKWFKFDLDN